MRDCQRSFGAFGGSPENAGLELFRPQNRQTLVRRILHVVGFPNDSWSLKQRLIILPGSSILVRPLWLGLFSGNLVRLQEKRFFWEFAYRVLSFETPNQPRRPLKREVVGIVNSKRCANQRKMSIPRIKRFIILAIFHPARFSAKDWPVDRHGVGWQN